MFRIFSSYQPMAMMLILAIGFGLWLPTLFLEMYSNDALSAGWLYNELLISAINTPWISKILSYIITAFTAFLLVQLNVWHSFFKARTYLPAFLFLIMAIPFVELHHMHPGLFPALCLVLILNKLFKMYKQETLSYNIFEASIILGIAILFDSVLVFFYPILLISLGLLRSFNWREWLFSLLGIFTVFFFVQGFHYVISGSTIEIFNIPTNFKSIADLSTLGSLRLTWLTYLMMLTFFSVIFLFGVITTKNLQARKFLFIIFWMFFLALMVFLINPINAFYRIIWVFIPMAFLITQYLLNIKRQVFPELILGVLMVIAVLSRFLA